ncbi:hypothetical protein KAFR_0H00580 [Kazachstania africana CBS 2517]|uniref:BZIP domain-containing protein n=1 Tax=Kazachstania africana (strain ATCC 22294 / BCRC 22015 / CBS 2517 / CECT 1963 / NBRC 1671 / NRRL Y-8276) TaxID=1071382 RepID=H2AYR1_KAZAF|nr:hypothetical protein KAFR_0H00580 [Kazachstania africana CBS 2517]CCF59467.1 hypothetical protein KAFR_0H00580 [Kazachstania africana CBS 2517]
MNENDINANLNKTSITIKEEEEKKVVVSNEIKRDNNISISSITNNSDTLTTLPRISSQPIIKDKIDTSNTIADSISRTSNERNSLPNVTEAITAGSMEKSMRSKSTPNFPSNVHNNQKVFSSPIALSKTIDQPIVNTQMQQQQSRMLTLSNSLSNFYGTYSDTSNNNSEVQLKNMSARQPVQSSIAYVGSSNTTIPSINYRNESKLQHNRQLPSFMQVNIGTGTGGTNNKPPPILNSNVPSQPTAPPPPPLQELQTLNTVPPVQTVAPSRAQPTLLHHPQNTIQGLPTLPSYFPQNSLSIQQTTNAQQSHTNYANISSTNQDPIYFMQQTQVPAPFYPYQQQQIQPQSILESSGTPAPGMLNVMEPYHQKMLMGHEHERDDVIDAEDTTENEEFMDTDTSKRTRKKVKTLRDSKRAVQNRNAQKAFRLRKERYIKLLENKSGKFDELCRENQMLRFEISNLKNLIWELENRLKSLNDQNIQREGEG